MATADTLTNDIRHEANTALLEIDKGLRSPRVGEQCEAIVKFPVLIDRFPFPVVINSAFLKIADVFRTGNNFIRLNIYKVLDLTEKHLKKITSVDEFIRRIYSVMHSNASLARAVTLRVFGSIACIVTERKNIHHSIHHGLESTDKVEVDAAIYATICLCKHSRTFAKGVCEKIMSMIEGLTTPVSMKLQLFPILSLMNHDINTATQVREFCIKLLPAYPSLSFVSAILHTLTELAMGTLIHLQDQVKLLLYYAGNDVRLSVRMKALNNLLTLATQLPHAWTQTMIRDFYSVLVNTSSEREKCVCGRLLYELSGSLAVHNMTFLKDDTSFQALCYSSCALVSAYTMGVATRVVVMAAEGLEDEKKREELEETAAVVMESLAVHDQKEGEGGSRLAMKVMLTSLTGLTTSCPVLSESALDALLAVLPNLSGIEAVLVCQSLASIAAQTPGTWSHVTPTLLDYLNNKTDHHHSIIVPVSTVLMELHQGDSGSGERVSFRDHVSPCLLSHIWALDHPSKFWSCYKVARRASMMGFHELAEPVYFKLSRLVTTVKFRNWLNALYQFSLAQAIISSSSSSSSSSSLIPSLSKSASIIYNAILLVKVSEVSSSFPGSFLRVYSSWLNAHYQLLATCVSFHTLPPPSTNYSNNFFEKKLRSCVSQFQTVSEQFSELYSSLFDADPSTLDYVSLLQQSCLLMASVISSIGLARKPLVSPGKVSTPIAETPVGQVEITDSFNTSYLLGKACRTVFHKSQVMSSSIQSLPFGGKHASSLIDSCKTILKVPVQLPKYFFNSSQLTTLKLALSPSPSSGSHHVLSANTHLTMKVEGVVDHSGSELYRSPAAVYVHVKPVLDRLHSSDAKPPVLNALEKTELVEKDYFEAQFLLDLPLPGMYSVMVKASLLDTDGRMWHIGQRAKMQVLVEGGEDPTKSQAKQQRESSSVASSSSSSKVGGTSKN